MEEQGAGGGLVYNPRVWSTVWSFVLAVSGLPCVNPVGEAWVSLVCYCGLLLSQVYRMGSFFW